MGRAPCCEKQGLKKGPWAPEEDRLLLDYIQAHGCGNWRSLPKHAGLLRCGKSCRLRWTNYLRPDIKRGAFTAEEEKSIVQLHAIVGNKWSTIAANIQGRTDNEIKNYWNTHLKKRLLRMDIVPDTYTPTPTKPNSSSSSSTTTTTTRHMAQWESARLEAEARLSQESLLSSSSPSAADKSLPSPTPVDFFLRIWNSPIGDAFRKPVTASTSCATATMPPPPHTSPLRSSNVTVTTSNEATGEETSEEEEEEEEEEDSYQLYFDFTAGDDLGFFQGQMGSCYSSLLADLSEASLDTAFK